MYIVLNPEMNPVRWRNRASQGILELVRVDMEKTFSSMSSLMLGQIGPRNPEVSPGFCALVKGIRRAASAVEQDEIIEKEIDLLRQKLAQPDIGQKKMKEFLVRLMYCEMLGHSASFGHITALKMAQQGSLSIKRVGYLAVSLFLHPNHELLLLLVNTIQKDLKSTNILDNCMALMAASTLFGPDMIPAIIHQVVEKLKHPNAMVRKKAVMTVYSFHVKAPHLIQHMTDKFKEALCDREPTVMGAALHIYNRLITNNPSSHQSLVRPLVSILMQITSRKLPLTFEFHGVPAPWMQIKILKMLAKLGHNNEYASNLIYDVLEQMMQNISLRQMVSYAVHYECISTIAAIYPNSELIDLAAKSVTKFLKSKDNNLKYLGIEALGQLLTVDPQCGSSHEMMVVDCLSDPDPTIKKKTLDLLYLMANDSNVSVICDKFLECLPTLSDVTSQQHLSENVVQMAKKYYQSLEWFLRTLCHLCQISDWSIPSLVTTVINIVQKEQDSHGPGISTTVVDVFLPFANIKIVDESLVQLTIWVLGEFSTRDISSLMLEDALKSLLLLLVNKDAEWDTDTKLLILSALCKIFAKSDNLEMNLTKHLTPLLKDEEPEIRQRTAELLVLTASSSQVKKEVLHYGITTGQCDWTLSFLDGYVSDALAQGAPPYKPKQQRTIEETTVQHDVTPQLFSGLNFQPYSAPSTFSRLSSSSLTSPSRPEDNNSSAASGGSSEHSNSRERTQPLDSSQLKLEGVKKVWGKSGYIKIDPQKQTNESSTPEKKETTTPSSSSVPSFQVSDASKPSVQLNDATASRTKEVSIKNNKSKTKEEADDDEEEETPEMKQKQDLAKALFGNVRQPKKKDLLLARSSSPTGSSNQSSSLLDSNRHVDLLSLSNEPEVQLFVGDHHSDNLKHPPVKLENITSVIQSDHVNQKQSESGKNFDETVVEGLNQNSHLLDDSIGSFQGDSVSLLDQISRTPIADSPEGDHRLPPEFEDFPHSKEFEQLCLDDMMRVTLCKVWKPKELGIVMFIYNKSGIHQVTDAELAINLPSNLKFLHRDGQKQTEVVGSVNIQSSKSVSFCCICQSPAVNMMLGGEVTYRDHTRTLKRLFFNTAINMSDLLRVHQLTTNEFGSLWGKPCHDVRLSHDNVSDGLQPLMQLLSTKLSFHIVEIKGYEALTATSLLGGTDCLAHFKLQNKKLDIWIKSNNKRLCDVLSKLISSNVTGGAS